MMPPVSVQTVSGKVDLLAPGGGGGLSDRYGPLLATGLYLCFIVLLPHMNIPSFVASVSLLCGSNVPGLYIATKNRVACNKLIYHIKLVMY